MLTPILRFTNNFYEVGEPPVEELFGINALVFGWIGRFPILPWITNIIYLLIISNRIPKLWILIILSTLNIILALTLTKFDYYIDETVFPRHYKTAYNVDVAYGFYAWLISYIILTIELILKNFAQQK